MTLAFPNFLKTRTTKDYSKFSCIATYQTSNIKVFALPRSIASSSRQIDLLPDMYYKTAY
jgi:hypothetical protein